MGYRKLLGKILPALVSSAILTQSISSSSLTVSAAPLNNEGNILEEVSLSGNEVSDEPVEDQAVPGGYIEMPWDNDTPVVDSTLDYSEALEMVVDEKENEDEYVPERSGYVSDPGTIEEKFPIMETEEEILSYLSEKYPGTRKQSPYGTCWAHSAIALSEFYMINHGLSDEVGTVDKDVNYSELQLAYFCYNQAPYGITGNTGDKVRFDPNKGEKKNFLDFGGNLNFASQSLMRYNGVADEADPQISYSNAETVLSDGLDDDYATSKNVIHLKNEYQINIRENERIVKQAIKENGIVGVSIYADDSFFNSATNAFYNNRDTNTNHAVAIVGWDDSFPASKFKLNPGRNGAWLVRNSWTESTRFAYHSYFWLSYADKSIADTAYVFEMADYEQGENYDNNYNYDSQLHNIRKMDSVKTANVFSAVREAEILKAVQIDATLNPAGAYTIEIYKNLTDSGNPESGTKVEGATTTGTLPFAGKYTIPLAEPVELTQDEVFSVIVTTEMPIDREQDMIWFEQVIADTFINAGESYKYLNGSWKDLYGYSNGGSYGNVCIRALTSTQGGVPGPENIVSLIARSRTDKSISLTWSAARNSEGYEIWYRAADDGSFTKAGTTGPGEKKYTVTGLNPGSTYYFKVYPIRSGEKYEAGLSPVISASTRQAIPEVEVVNIGNYTITARWEAMDGCEGYAYQVINRTLNQAYYEKETDETEVRIIDLNPANDYTISVRSFKTMDGNKSYSEACEKDFSTGNGSGHAVTGLKAQPYNEKSVVLTFDDQEEAYTYNVKMKTGSTDYADTPYYRFEGEPRNKLYIEVPDSQTRYYFKVTAKFSKWASGNYDEYTSDPVESYTKLPSVSSIKAVAVPENGSIEVSWSSVTGANYYSIYRKPSNVTEFAPLAVVPASGSLIYEDTSVSPGRTYYYRVYGCRTNVMSDEQGVSNRISGTRINLGSVNDLSVGSITGTSAVLSWSAVAGAEEYVIKKYDPSSSSWVEIDRIPSTYLTYSLSGLIPQTQYRYSVQAATDEQLGGGTSKSFYTLDKALPSASLFSVDAPDTEYDGSGHGAEVTSSVQEINDAGITVYYGRVVNGAVSSYSTSLPVNAGTYRVKIKTAGSTYYAAAELTDAAWEFTVSPKILASPEAVLGQNSFTYSGSPVTPSVTVSSGFITLTEHTDYEVSYSDNVNAGTGKVLITGKTGSNYSFEAFEKDFPILKKNVTVSITGHHGTSEYDGHEHSVNGYDASIGDVLYSRSSFTFNGTAVSARTGAGTTYMGLVSGDFENNDDNFNVTFDVTDGYQTITPVSGVAVTITGHSDSRVYDGQAHTVTGYDFRSDNPLFTEDDISFTGSASAVRTAAGTTYMGLTSSQFANNNANFVNVVFSITDGKQIITRADVNVSVSGNTRIDVYDGNEHTVSGYSVISISNELFEESDISYTGNKQASRTNAGTTAMGLSASDFTSSSDNFNVAFSVTDGFQTITPVSGVVVTITGHSNSSIYDGQDHEVSGYDVSISNPLFTESDIGFSGTARAHRTMAGKTNMGLSPESFSDINDYGNFSSVVFNVTDGYQEIRKASPGVTPPSAKNQTYTGMDLELINPGSASGGIIMYSLSENGPFSTDVPVGRNAGSYTVFYKVFGNDNYTNTDPVQISCRISKSGVSDKYASGSAKYGGSTSIDLSSFIVEGGSLKDGISVVDNEQVLNGTPSLNGYTLSFEFKNEPDNTDKTAEVEIGVNGGQNHGDYRILVTLTVLDKLSRSVSFEGGSGVIEKTYGDADFTRAALPTSGDGSITYSSGNVSVATVDPSTGKVHIIKPGTAVITAYVSETDEYAGASEVYELKVNRKTISLLWKNTSFTYDGTSRKPAAEATGLIGNDTCLVEVSGERTDAGAYVATAVSIDNSELYRLPDERTCSFTIEKRSIRDAVITLDGSLTYSGNTLTQRISNVKVGDLTLSSADYNVSGNTVRNAGNYELKVTAVADSNYTGSAQTGFSVAKKPLNPVVEEITDQVYTGHAITPAVTVLDGETGLEDSDLTVMYSDNLEAGTANVTVSAAANGNYSFDDISCTFTILKADHPDTESEVSLRYGCEGTLDLSSLIEESGAASITEVADEKGILNEEPVISEGILSFSLKNDREVVGNSAGITIQVSGAANYNNYRIAVKLTASDKMAQELVFEKSEIVINTGETCKNKLIGAETAVSFKSENEEVATIDADGLVTALSAGRSVITVEAVETDDYYSSEARYILIVNEKTEPNSETDPNGGEEETVPQNGTDTGDTVSGDSMPETTVEETVFKDSSGADLTLYHDKVSNTYKTADGADVVVINDLGGSSPGIPEYSYIGKKITPGKEGFVVYRGTVYKFGTDYKASYKKNKKAGMASLIVKWNKNSTPYEDGEKKTVINFSIVPRKVDASMVSYTTNGTGEKIKKLNITADGYTIKAGKKDYSFVHTEQGFQVVFKNNFEGTVMLKQ